VLHVDIAEILSGLRMREQPFVEIFAHCRRLLLRRVVQRLEDCGFIGAEIHQLDEFGQNRFVFDLPAGSVDRHSDPS
jgi:hypothetical protein